MKYAKILGLAAMALAALMAMAGTASATNLTSPSGTVYTGTIKAESSHAVLTGPFGFGTITCTKSVVEGKVEKHGTNVTVFGNISNLTFEVCTGGEPTTPVTQPGSLELHNAGGGLGTVTSLNADVIVHKTALGTCTFNTVSTGTDIGTLTTTAVTGGNAVLDIAGTIPGSCGSGKWEGSYKVVTPSTLYID